MTGDLSIKTLKDLELALLTTAVEYYQANSAELAETRSNALINAALDYAEFLSDYALISEFK